MRIRMHERCSHYHVLIILKWLEYFDRTNKQQHTKNVYGVIQVHLNLFVNKGTFPEQIAITEMFS